MDPTRPPSFRLQYTIRGLMIVIAAMALLIAFPGFFRMAVGYVVVFGTLGVFAATILDELFSS
jgi:hypothetical protein